jgi:RNA polymerase sigma-70 factor (ECF subfamily)
VNLAEFEHTVITCRHRLFRYAWRLTGDREDAADLVQDSMLKLWRHRDTVHSGGAVAWLLRVVRNAAFDLHRRRVFERGVFDGARDVDDEAGTDSATDRVAEAGSLRNRLERALDRLREPYRSIVILREVEDFRYDEIAGALDLPLNTVKVYLHRGRHMLRESITRELHGEPN